MRPPLYRNQLVRDLDAWIEQGLVPAANRSAILAQVDQTSRFGLSAALALLGAGLIAAAILSFIAANWQGLDKLPRLVLLALGLWGSFGLAAWARRARLDAAAETALLVGTGIYGAAIWLVGQAYHLSGSVEDGLMLWALGALVAAWLAVSQTMLTIGFVLAASWVMTAWVAGHNMAFLICPPVFLAGAVYAARQSWPVALQAGILASLVYIFAAAYRWASAVGWSAEAASAPLAAVCLAIWCALHIPAANHEWALRPARVWAIILTVTATLLLSFIDRDLAVGAWLPVAITVALILAATAAAALVARRLDLVDAGAAVLLGLGVLLFPLLPSAIGTDLQIPILTLVGLQLVWIVTIGLRRGDRLAVNGGFIAFGFWVAYLYAVVFDDYLSGALFFAVGGAVLIGLGWGLDRMRRVVLAQTKARA